MRTRFLAADYFAPSPTAAASADRELALASFPFPSFPVPTPPPDPHLPAPSPFPADFLPVESVAGDDLDSLPVASALSDILSSVIPRPLPVPDLPAADEGLGDYLYDGFWDDKGFSSTDPVAFKIPKGLGEISHENGENGENGEASSLGASAATKRRVLLEELRFEVVEVDILPILQRKIASFDDEEPDGGVTFSFGVPDVKIHLDFIDIDTETTIIYPSELAESIYQVEKIHVKHDDDEDCARDSYCLEIAGQDHATIIPQLEVSRNSWELDELPAKTAISNIFHNIVEHLNNGVQVHHPAFDSTEFLKSPDMDMLALVCKDVPRVEYQAEKPIVTRDLAEMDLVKINGDILLEKKSALYPLKPDGTCSDLPCSILLEEIEIVDFPPNDVFKMLGQSDKAEMYNSDEVFKDDFDQARRFYESVVSSELALVDDTFKSLPTPILADDNTIRSMLPPIEEVLCSLKPLPLSAADGIYLDWHLLSEGSCNREICSTHVSMVEEVKPCILSSELHISCQQTPAIGIDFLEDVQRSAKLQDERNEVYVPAPVSHGPQATLETAQKCRPESDVRSPSQMEKWSSEKASSLFESVSKSNEQNFYLTVKNGTNNVRNHESIATLDIPPPKQETVQFSTRSKVDKLIEIHPVSLSNLIRGLIKDIHVNYASALQESAYFRNCSSDGQGLSISKQRLLELITGEGSEGLYSYCKNGDKMELITLYALKQVAYYLCFFGLHAAHLYIGNLTGSFENIPQRLRNIQCCIDEAWIKAQKQLFESHPSLSDIETILRSNTQIGQKILIIADRAFWLPLSQKLTAMKITTAEFGKYPSATYSDPAIKTNSKTRMVDELWKSDCVVLDNKNIPASFPFSQFGIILEYGGPNKSSTLLSLAPKLDGLPPLHFLYVKMDDEDFAVALVEDNNTDQDAVLHSLQKDLQEKMNKMRIVDSLNFIPATNKLQHLQERLSKHLAADTSKKIPADAQLHNEGHLDEKIVTDSHNIVPAAEQLDTWKQKTIVNSQFLVPAIEKSSSTSSVSANMLKADQDNKSASDFPLRAKIDSTMLERPSAPEVAIVVNIGNHGKNMLFSRRSSYQQILALEKGGMKVVERDIDLPVDLIPSASVCLLWYDTRTFGSSELTVSAEASSITNFIEDIATNILMALSFTFSVCIMVFEGENNFLSAVMEASDSLYASAASLDLNLELFFSQTPKSTDQIILNCIQNATRINQAPSPVIYESERLAESFLTAFPSINPLSAHMILSSGSLLDFLSWSPEQRIQAVEKYLLPPQSISLFGALCKFGELGESRSIMTECSSVDSDISSALLQSPRKRKKRAAQEFAVAAKDPLFPNRLSQSHDDSLEHVKVFSPPNLRKFSQMEGTMPGLPEVFVVDQNQSLNLGIQGVNYQPRQREVNAVTGNQAIDDEFIHELTPNFRTYNERTSSVAERCNFSWQSELGAKQPTRSSFPTSRPSFYRTSSHPAFPSALEIVNSPGDWDASCGTNQAWMGLHGDFATGSRGNDFGNRYDRPREEIMHSPSSSLAFLNQDFGCHGMSQGSGWEMDYLRQMNEKRLACQDRSRCNTSATLLSSRRDGSSRVLSAPPIESFRYQRNIGNPSRDQNPSNVESSRYQRNVDTPLRDQSPLDAAHRYGQSRGGTKGQSYRVRKDLKAQPSINHGKSIVPSIEPTWTPLDKRARQKLSFATYGKEKQSKLVWRHQTSPGVGCGFRKRYREEDT